ncbi:MAG: peptidase family protein [Patescibacteria group bacterium]|nr:peptidase family protein [Patescibacteria group bacterium]
MSYRNKSRPIHEKLLCAVILSVGLAAGLVVFFAAPKTPAPTRIPVFVQTATSHQKNAIAKRQSAKYGLPARLSIPAIQVGAAIEPLGLTPDGVMAAPTTPDGLAWYKLGPRPGEAGNAVIAGHFGQWPSGQGSVFDNLFELRRGDLLYAEDDAGVITRFMVRESRSYDPEADASDVFDSHDGGQHLNLITCMGTWNKALGSYPRRLVVFADID